MTPYRHILVGLDFTPASIAALAAVKHFSAKSRIAITVINVVEPSEAARIKRVYGFDEDQLVDQGREKIFEICAEMGIAAPLVEAKSLVGNPSHTLAHVCSDLEAALLILGSRGSEHCPAYMGATASKCVHESPIDVMLVKERVLGSFNNPLVCVDFSEGSTATLLRAGQLALMERSTLVCLHVHLSRFAMSLANAVSAGAGFIEEDDSIEDLEYKLDTHVRSTFTNEMESLKWVSGVREASNIREGIIKYIKEKKHDLVVIGSHQSSRFHQLFAEVTAGRLINHTDCSVLVVKSRVQA